MCKVRCWRWLFGSKIQMCVLQEIALLRVLCTHVLLEGSEGYHHTTPQHVVGEGTPSSEEVEKLGVPILPHHTRILLMR